MAGTRRQRKETSWVVGVHQGGPHSGQPHTEETPSPQEVPSLQASGGRVCAPTHAPLQGLPVNGAYS